jgi:hypothetical protein
MATTKTFNQTKGRQGENVAKVEGIQSIEMTADLNSICDLLSTL